MRQRTELRQRQNLGFNAQFSNTVRILQMTNGELTDEVQAVLDSNPLLEQVEFDSSVSAENFFSFPTLSPFSATGTGVDADAVVEHAAQLNFAPTIRDHLRSQILLSGLNDSNRQIALAIADSIDDRGYLIESTSEISQLLPFDVSVRTVNDVLEFVQRLDPPGVAAHSLRQCLAIQLEQNPDTSVNRKNAMAIVDSFLDKVAEFEFQQIADELNITRTEVQAAVELIQTLNPVPGASFGESSKAIVPDVIATKKSDRWLVALNEEVLPKIRVSSQYHSMIAASGDQHGNRYLKKNLSGANIFLDSINRRHLTILRVARELVEHQQDFLEHGPSQMRPLALRDVADVLGLHESTVSRACSAKYIMTPKGTFELKSLFSGRVNRLAGGDISTKSVQHEIAQLIENEDCNSPLSDQQVTDRLRAQGIEIARRTVVKYRSIMNIPTRKIRKAKKLNQTINMR